MVTENSPDRIDPAVWLLFLALVEAEFTPRPVGRRHAVRLRRARR